MTDGILLAEIQRDRMLRRYDTLIIDEAHERSLNIDFLLGYLKQLLPRRPDLKVDHHLGDDRPAALRPALRARRAAPVIEVSGRTYPVEVRYRPLVETERRAGRRARRRQLRDQIQAICDAVDELRARGPGDVLVFLSGEREIRDTADALGRLDLRRHRDPAAVRPAVRGRAAPGVPAAHRPADRAGHQRRRDVADRARHPLRRSTPARRGSPATATG